MHLNFDRARVNDGSLPHRFEESRFRVCSVSFHSDKGVDSAQGHGAFVTPEHLSSEALDVIPAFGAFCSHVSLEAFDCDILKFEFGSYYHGLADVVRRGLNSLEWCKLTPGCLLLALFISDHNLSDPRLLNVNDVRDLTHHSPDLSL